MKYTKFKKRKIKKYRIYFRKSYWKPLKKSTKGWKYTKRGLEWFASKGIKAYAKRIK